MSCGIRKRTVLIPVVTCVAGFAGGARADFTSYDSRPAYDADAVGDELIDFSFTGTPLEVTGTGHLLRPDPFAIPDTDIEIRGISEDLYLLGPGFATGATVGLTINGPYNTADGTTYLKSGIEAEFIFGPAGINMFGIDVFTLLAPSSPLGVEVYVESITGDTLFEDQFDMDTFVGFVSDVPIGLITFGLVGSLTEGEAALGFDNMSFGVTGEPLPAPAAAILGLTGFATLAAVRRRRRNG
ncbi:MAG: hypothetical protein HOP29_19325 [Phycisphaerales bacterium]|nr:hypothetical protein [Phycisphaerales bacterium]